MKYKTLEDANNAREVIACPGDTLLEMITHKSITQTELGKRMGRPLKTINEIIMGKAAITPETAIQLARVIGPSPDFWLSYEKNYRLELAEIQESEMLIDSREWIKNFPLSNMLKLGWISFENDTISKTNALLNYFSVANKESFEAYYAENLYAAAFRIGKKFTRNPYAIAAWLRQGDIQAGAIQAPDWDAKRFKNSLPTIKDIMAGHPVDFFQHLQSVCLQSGLKLVYTPCLPGAPVNGATRWINDSPLIQLTDRYKRNDIFWFTFFHEAGHILLHGKKDVFVEGMGYNEDLVDKEQQADEFAVKWTLSADEEQEIIDSRPLSPAEITGFARKFSTHEAIIIGRLAKHGYIHDSVGWNHHFYEKVILD